MASVSDPFTVFDTYDWRWVIENGIFKEGKYPWQLLPLSQAHGGGGGGALPFYLAGHGLVYRFSLVASQTSEHSHPSTHEKATRGLSTALLGEKAPLVGVNACAKKIATK